MKLNEIRYYGDDAKFDNIESFENLNTEVSIVDDDTFTMAQKLYDTIRDENVCCLNFASHQRPGGGYKAVRNIAMPIKTQEEDLFRRSDLPEIMDIPLVRTYYPLHGVQGFYCIATVFKDKSLKPVDPFETAVITIPAVVNPSEDPNSEKSYKLVEAKIKRVLEIAGHHHHNTLILGAWGCGVFNNDPQKIVDLFLKYIHGEFKSVFNKVIFAIPGENTTNHKIFKLKIEGQ